MRSFCFAAALLITLLGINVYCYNFIKESSIKLENNIDEIVYYLNKNDDENVEKSFNELKEQTIESKKVWFLIINHEEIDNVDVKIKECEGYIKKEADNELLASLNSLKFYINNIYEREKVNIPNIF
ncbi:MULTISPECIES: DUF4363 family protein [Anaerofustis]|uniref:DUF4363 family protein n=1 Tax=Anaerofustis TaxID=264995 RepID=UPI0011073546|nr:MULTISPECIES: DUF4363 family protein [Anaerofustis]MCO8192862.1 DUF4363 family protein [Anaerofustis sp. NSJ-163]